MRMAAPTEADPIEIFKHLLWYLLALTGVNVRMNDWCWSLERPAKRNRANLTFVTN